MVNERGAEGMKLLRGTAAGALGVLLGLQALRTFLTSLVWMIGEQLSPNTMGTIALGVVALGLLSGLIKRKLGQGRTERLTATVLTLLYLGALAVPNIAQRTGLSAAATMVWIWWFAAFAGKRRSLASALVGGLSLDVAVHALLRGLDLPVGGPLSATALVGLAFIATACDPGPAGPSTGWGTLALGPWLFVQMEVLSNLARLRILTGLAPGPALALAEMGLAVALAVMALPMPGLVRAALGLLGALLLLHPSGVLWVLGAQAGAAAALAGALGPGRVRLWPPLSVLLLVGLFFLFYSQSTWPLLPAVAMALLGLISLLVRSGTLLPSPRRLLAVPCLLAAVALLAGLGAPARPASPSAVGTGTIRLMTYNIHQGLNLHSLPAPEAIAREIEAAAPDLVALQEVNRGWTISGNSDLVTWLEQRLPDYHLVYGPMVGDLWGTAILSRFPIKASGSERYEPGLFFTIGFTWAVVALPGCNTLVLNTHLSTGPDLGGERAAQMSQLLTYWNGRPCTIIMGDANAEPSSEAIRRLTRAGFTDWLGRTAGPRAGTWPSDKAVESIDYVATTAEFQAVAARTNPSAASDHRPIIVELVLRP